MIYLDNCATTRMRDEVSKLMYEYERDFFGNPSSLHSLGLKSQKDISEVRKYIAGVLAVFPDEIYFTSSGTESNNIALKGVMAKFGKRKKHILVSPIEHSSVWEEMKVFKDEGYEVETLSVDNDGRVNPEEVSQKLRIDTALISIMQVNNEIGVIQPIDEIGEVLKREKSQAIFHVDGLQGFMKTDINLKKSNVKLYTAGSHKIYGPKGVGLLFVDKSLNIPPLMQGGGQERGLRSSTENVPGIMGFGKAIQLMHDNANDERHHALNLKERVWNALSEIPDIIKLTPEISSPYILTIAFKNVPGEVLLHYLERDEIYISTSSACNSNGHKKSRTAQAINLNEEYSKGIIRICFSYENTEEEIDFATEKIKKYVGEIREII